MLGAAEVEAGAVEVRADEVAIVELGTVELGTVELGAGELGADELGVGEEHVVVGKNCPRGGWPAVCASTWTKHLPSADSSSGTVTPSP